MSERALLYPLVAIATIAATARGQGTDDLAQKRRAVEIAARAYVAAANAYQQENTARLQLPRVRTYSGAQVRADTAFVRPEFLVRLDSGFARARQQATAVFGVTTDSLLVGTQLILTPASPRGSAQNGQSIHAEGLRPPSARWARYVGNDVWGNEESLDNIAAYFVSWFENAAGTVLPPAIAAWMGSHTSALPEDPRWREAEHYGLVMHPSGVGLACANGAIPACHTALALVPGADTIGAWFDAASRRALVIRALENHNVRRRVLRIDAEAADRCTESGDEAACRVVLGRVGVSGPTSRSSRERLVRIALERGGEHAFERLRADATQSVDRAIAAAAGVPLDSLLIAWRESVLAARPPSPAPTIREIIMGLALMGSLVGFTARRKP